MYDKQDPVGQAVKMGAKLFAILADEVTTDFGIQGEQAVRRAVARFGTQRAEGIKSRILDDGREVTFETADQYSDYPPNNAWDSDEEIKGNTFRELTRSCPFSQAFREIGLEQVGRLYCEEIDVAIHSTLFGAIEFERPQIFTDGEDAPCEMIVTKLTES